MARYMKKDVPGILVPDEVIERMERAVRLGQARNRRAEQGG